MVVFTCGHCGESVQKPKVEKHYQIKCRNRNPNLSCMDCFKDFLGDAYETHTKCISEAERYSGKGFQAKENKGEKRQETWVEMLQSVLEEQPNAPRNVVRIIETVSKHNNTPRKKPKFFNFVKNVCGNKTNPTDIDQAWNMISVKLSALSNANNNKNKNENQKNSATGKTDKSEENSLDSQDDNKTEENKDSKKLNGSTEDLNGEVEKENNTENGEIENENSNKKLSKKQRKEEKKRKKYEAELQSAEVLTPEIEEEVAEEPSKKGKKKKTKSECSNGDAEETQKEAKNKKKRKRQDTTNSVPEILENEPENVENQPLITKASKKKLKVAGNVEAKEESICLHDQNVAKIEELTVSSDKFNWHGIIRSLLEKKDNEMQFKRLQKKVLMEYSEATGQDVDDRIAEKFIKKLRSAPNIRVDKNRVVLIE